MIGFFKKIILGIKLVFYKRSYLNQTGYVDSKIRKTLKVGQGGFVPWMNYSVIHLLSQRLQKDSRVFEYGSGASTMFWAEKCHSVVSVEYDAKWFDIINEHVSKISNARLIHLPEGPGYIESISTIEENTHYDLVIVDGRERVACSKFALPFLSEKGVLILDDSRRAHYQEAIDFYSAQGYNNLTLQGLKPTGFGMDQTTIFYRSGNNVLGL